MILKTCDIAGDNHSKDVTTVYCGGIKPLYRCGFHIQKYGTHTHTGFELGAI